MDSDKILEILKMFDHRQTTTMKEILEMGIVLEYLTNLMTADMTPEQRTAAEEDFKLYRDSRFAELKKDWDTLKTKAVEMQD